MDYQNKLTFPYFSPYFDDKRKNFLPPRESSPLVNNTYRYEPYDFLKAEQIFIKNRIPLNNFTLKRDEILFEKYFTFCHGRNRKAKAKLLQR